MLRYYENTTVIYSFPGGTVGTTPNAGLIFNASGNLYSTAYLGGAKNYGTVFELKTVTGGGWQGRLLHAFTGKADGGNSTSNLIFDSSGNLYGTTNYGRGWHETILHAFAYGRDGSPTVRRHAPRCGRQSLRHDGLRRNPNTCIPKNQGGCGVVYELSPASGGGWHEKVLHAFNGPEGASSGGRADLGRCRESLRHNPGGGGRLNNCCRGGISGCGVVFELSPTSGGAWQETVLHAFTGGADGAYPGASLTFDASGSLYGAASRGGNLSASQCIPNGCGVVFKLSLNSVGGWHETVLHTFTGPDGAVRGGVIFDASGNLYGTTAIGGPNGNGTVFEITP